MSPTGLWDRGFQFGDWLDPDSPPDRPWAANADRGVVATACLYRSAATVAATARIIGRDDDAAAFEALAARTRRAFNEHYVARDGTIKSDAVTVYALAIVFGLLDLESAHRAGERLAELVAANGYRIATGFAGTPYVTDALTVTGHVDDAYAFCCSGAARRGCTPWGWEPRRSGSAGTRCSRMEPMNSGEMTSFNHYALGAVADWMHRAIGGIAPLEAGYARVLIAPRPGGGLTWASASLDSRHGRIEVDWQEDGDELSVEVSLPEGVTGVLDLAGHAPSELGSGRHESRTRTT